MTQTFWVSIDKHVRNKTKLMQHDDDHLKHIPDQVTMTQVHKFISKSWKKNVLA